MFLHTFLTTIKRPLNLSLFSISYLLTSITLLSRYYLIFWNLGVSIHSTDLTFHSVIYAHLDTLHPRSTFKVTSIHYKTLILSTSAIFLYNGI